METLSNALTGTDVIANWPEESREAARCSSGLYPKHGTTTRGSFLDARRWVATPYMAELRFDTGVGTADPDARAITEEELQHAKEQGERQGR